MPASHPPPRLPETPRKYRSDGHVFARATIKQDLGLAPSLETGKAFVFCETVCNRLERGVFKPHIYHTQAIAEELKQIGFVAIVSVQG